MKEKVQHENFFMFVKIISLQRHRFLPFQSRSVGRACAVIVRPVHRASLLLSMLEIELYQIFLSLGHARSGYEIKLKYDVTFILISRAAILLASSAGERDRGSVNEKCILLENAYSCILNIFCHTDLHRPPYRPMP